MSEHCRTILSPYTGFYNIESDLWCYVEVVSIYSPDA